MRAVTLGFSGQFTEDCQSHREICDLTPHLRDPQPEGERERERESQSHREREVVYSVYSVYSFEAVSILV